MAIDPLTPERRRERTRQHLIDAGAVVFSQRGYAGASLDEVAAAAGFTKGAVYSNFKNKEDLFVAVLEDRLQGQIRAIEDLLADDPRPAAEQLATIRELVSPHETGNWTVLYLEFLVYAARNPAARAQVAAYRRRSRDAVERLVTREWGRLGTAIEPAIPAAGRRHDLARSVQRPGPRPPRRPGRHHRADDRRDPDVPPGRRSGLGRRAGSPEPTRQPGRDA